MRFKLKLFILFLLAPFLGLALAYAQLQPFTLTEAETLALREGTFQEEIARVNDQLQGLTEGVGETCLKAGEVTVLAALVRENAREELQAYQQQYALMQGLVKSSTEQQGASGDTLDYLLTNMLGDPLGQTFGENATVKVYSLTEAGYRGYMAKVRLHDIKALKMVLAGDQVAGKGETTSHAAGRSGAVLAVNAGGFFASGGNLVPLGITVVDGEVLTFSQTDLSFIGFNSKGRLVGGNITTREQLAALDVLHGASFLPTLLKDSKKQPIPSDWANTRHPRTLIGHFENGDLLFIVIDGRREGWSMGVTLEEAQNKLLEFNVRDAYNLDGGGSSTFYYNGKVLNRPSGGAERKVTTNIVVIP